MSARRIHFPPEPLEPIYDPRAGYDMGWLATWVVLGFVCFNVLGWVYRLVEWSLS